MYVYVLAASVLEQLRTASHSTCMSSSGLHYAFSSSIELGSCFGKSVGRSVGRSGGKCVGRSVWGVWGECARRVGRSGGRGGGRSVGSMEEVWEDLILPLHPPVDCGGCADTTLCSAQIPVLDTF